MAIALLFLGLALGGVVAWLLAHVRIGSQLSSARAELSTAQTQLESERRSTEEKLALVERANVDWQKRFEEISAHALQKNNAEFMTLADAKLAPLTSKLTEIGEHTRQLEASRQNAYAELKTQVQTLATGAKELRAETGSLVTALRAPAVRGRWGEMQLRRAVEAAGMLDRCDFMEQVTVQGEDARLRPDLVVKLPGGRNVVVDAKVPLTALLDGLDETLTPEERAAKLADFKRHVRDHVAKLGAKGYWQQFTPAPDFVVMFLPGESFYRSAIEQDPELLELHASAGVIIASPTILISLLRAVAVGWREEKVAESARAVSELGRELYSRLATMVGHFESVGKRLDGAVQAYNQTVGSLERRVLPAARRFPEHGIGAKKEIGELTPIETSAQLPQTIELPRAADAA
jgi:DNA recombination protein RmuC